MDRCIVYTRHDGGVSVCTPTPFIMAILSNGGLWDQLPRGAYDRQIASMVRRGVSERAAHRYARAAMLGGCTTAEAYEIIRDRDCAHLGTAHELWDADDVPTDRWFRDAWSRSHNGGPISIDLKKARPIQMRRIVDAVFEENMRRKRKLTPPIEFDRDLIRSRIMQARDEIELRSIWPGHPHG